MNKNRFRRVFSKRLGMLVAVAEDVASQGKAPGEGSAAQVAPASGIIGVISSLTAFAAAILAMQPGVSFAQALPTGGQVAAGQASISQNSNTMTINQGSQRTVINWDSFNVGSGNTVQFNQPNAQSQALNRVSGAGASIEPFGSTITPVPFVELPSMLVEPLPLVLIEPLMSVPSPLVELPEMLVVPLSVVLIEPFGSTITPVPFVELPSMLVEPLPLVLIEPLMSVPSPLVESPLMLVVPLSVVLMEPFGSTITPVPFVELPSMLVEPLPLVLIEPLMSAPLPLVESPLMLVVPLSVVLIEPFGSTITPVPFVELPSMLVEPLPLVLIEPLMSAPLFEAPLTFNTAAFIAVILLVPNSTPLPVFDVPCTVNTTDNGTTNISGDSTNGDGTDINGSINTSGNGSTNIDGNSTNGTGTDIGPNATINTTGNGTTDISGNSTNGTGVINDEVDSEFTPVDSEFTPVDSELTPVAATASTRTFMPPTEGRR